MEELNRVQSSKKKESRSSSVESYSITKRRNTLEICIFFDNLKTPSPKNSKSEDQTPKMRPANIDESNPLTSKDTTEGIPLDTLVQRLSEQIHELKDELLQQNNSQQHLQS